MDALFFFVDSISLMLIKDILTIIAGFCTIIAFYLWKRNAILSRRLLHLEDFYLVFIEMYEKLDSLYSPKLFGMSVDSMVNKNDTDLKICIHNFRRQEIINNFKLHDKVMSKKPIIKVYFKNIDSIISDFYTTWSYLVCATTGAYEKCPDQIKNFLCLDDELLKIYRQRTWYKKNYTNPVLEKLNGWKNDIEKQLNDLIKDYEIDFFN